MNARSSFRWAAPVPVPAIKKCALHNEILLGLAQSESAVLLSKLECVALKPSEHLAEMGQAITHVYFVNDGLASVLSQTPDDDSVEIGMIGKEGFVGTSIIFGLRTSIATVVAQLAGTAFRISLPDIEEGLRECPDIKMRMARYSAVLAIQGTQLVACNQFHAAGQRVARWLLMCDDRIGTDEIPITHENLGRLLGIRRPSVSDEVAILERAGAVEKFRGAIKIVNRNRLEDAACECYTAIVQQHLRCRRDWQGILL
jgi:CRP-like cAMP-binding protein